MSFDSIRQAIVDKISSVDDAGQVHDHYRYSSDWGTFLDQFAYTPSGGKRQTRGWWVSIPTVRTALDRMSEFALDGDDGLIDLLDWPIRCVMSFSDKDGSEAAFENLIYTVRNTLRKSLTLGQGGDIIVPGSVDVTIPKVEPRQYGSILCHYAEMQAQMLVHVGGLDYVL